MSEENNGSSGEDGSGGETASWGGQDGWIIESDGMAKYLCREGEEYAIYQLDGTYVLGEMLEVVAGASTTFIGGAEVNVITPLEATIFLGFGINWNVAAKHIELHGASHWLTAFSDGWNQQSTNFAATSVGSHTQTVEGELTWSVAGSESWEIDGNSDVLVAANATWSATGNMGLEAKQMTISGLTATNISGATSAQFSGGGNSVLLNATEASLLCGTAGIKATAASTVISGAKVEIGLPNGPVAVATADEMAEVNSDVRDLEAGTRAAVNDLRTKLQSLERKFSKSLLGKLA